MCLRALVVNLSPSPIPHPKAKMHLTLTPTHLKLDLDWQERLWAFHFGSPIEIPLEQIVTVSCDRPATTWRELRAPGTAIPSLIKAGTYYTDHGREFWYATPPWQFLNLQLRDHYYKGIHLTLPDNQNWCDRLS